MNTSSEIDLNNHNPSGPMATEMAMRQLTFKEIGVEGICQSRLPSISEPSIPSKKRVHKSKYHIVVCTECGNEIEILKHSRLILCDNCKEVRTKLLNVNLFKKKKKVPQPKKKPPTQKFCTCGKLIPKDERKYCQVKYCVECKKEKKTAYGREKWKRIREEDPERYKELCKKRSKWCWGDLSEAEKERRRKRARERHRSNPQIIDKERRKEMQRRRFKYDMVALENKRQCNRNRRMQKRGTKEDFTNDDWLELVKETNGYCPNCGRKTTEENPMSLDHIIPLSKAEMGFVYTINDVQPLCKSCNSTKGNRIV